MAVRHPDPFWEFWQRQAATYDRRISAVEDRFLAEGRRWVGERAYGDVLEVAVGTGLTLPYYPDGLSIDAIEWSPAMLVEGRRRAAALGLEVNFHLGDAMRLPYPDASYDTVVSTYAMCCLADERAALAEAARVLRPGGSLLLADHVVSTAWPVRLGQRLLDRFTVPAQGEHWTRRPLDLLAPLGFEVVDSERRTYGVIESVHAVLRT